jgi:hypothetical protein
MDNTVAAIRQNIIYILGKQHNNIPAAKRSSPSKVMWRVNLLGKSSNKVQVSQERWGGGGGHKLLKTVTLTPVVTAAETTAGTATASTACLTAGRRLKIKNKGKFLTFSTKKASRQKFSRFLHYSCHRVPYLSGNRTILWSDKIFPPL